MLTARSCAGRADLWLSATGVDDCFASDCDGDFAAKFVGRADCVAETHLESFANFLRRHGEQPQGSLSAKRGAGSPRMMIGPRTVFQAAAARLSLFIDCSAFSWAIFR